MLILGKFKQAESYLECVLTHEETIKKVKLLIKKQYYLELISKKTEEKDTGEVLELLNGLERDEDIEFFEEMCELLTLKSIKEKDAYKNWSILRGREDCFLSILPFIIEKIGKMEVEFPREFDYFKCFKGLLLSQKFDFLDKKKMKILENLSFLLL